MYGHGDTLHWQKGTHVWAWGHFALAKRPPCIGMGTLPYLSPYKSISKSISKCTPGRVRGPGGGEAVAVPRDGWVGGGGGAGGEGGSR